MSLFLVECKNVLKSYIYYVFVAVVLLFYISQMGHLTVADLEGLFSPPVRLDTAVHGAPYGWKESPPSRAMIPAAVMHLYQEYNQNSYSTYPLGIYKNIKLSASKTQEVRLVLEEIIKHSIGELDTSSKMGTTQLPVDENLTMERFFELMAKLDGLLGGGSAYSVDGLSRFSRTPKTYEEAVEEWEYMVQNDRVTNGLARLFSDYLGIVMGIFPMFVAVFMSIKDRRTKMEQVVFFRKASSARIVLSRYFALVAMTILPVILLGIKETVTSVHFANSHSYPIDFFAFGRYIVWWLLPALMFVTALGAFLTYLTDTPVAIVVGLGIWFFNVNSIRLTGDYPLLGLFVRHNSARQGMLIVENYGSLWANRLTITGLALFFILLTIFTYKMKRSGRLDLGSTLRESLGFSQSKF